MNNLQFIVIGTFEYGNDDIVLASCDTEQEAKEFAENIDVNNYSEMYGELEFVRIYKSERIDK